MRINHLFHLDELTPQLKNNFIHYLGDISWWGLYCGTIVPFATVYAVRVGATNQQVGLMSAAPAAVALLLALPAGRMMRRADPRRSTAWLAFIQRFLFLGYALIPALVPPEHQVAALILLTVAIAVPGAPLSISFPQLLIDAVPAEWRGQLIGWRNAIFSILTFLVTILAGFILSWLVFPIGYEIIFVIGTIGGLMTAYHLGHVHALPDTGERLPLPGPSNSAVRRSLLPADQVSRHYLKIILLLFVFNTINSMVNPLVPVFTVNSLKLSDATLSIGYAINIFLQAAISLFISRLTRRTGNHRATALGAALLALHALVLAFAGDASLYLVSMVLNGAGAGILISAQYNYNIESVPPLRRATWLSYNTLLGNAAVLLGSLAGPALATGTDIPVALALFAGLRLFSGVLIFKMG